jgi:AcrR family transcriptional regulator
MPVPRQPRADAARNREKILAAARDQIATRGLAAGMDEIAASAGVAVGTLYRHFPNKGDLVAAVLADYISTVADETEAALRRAEARETRPIDEITTLLGNIFQSSVTDGAIKAAAGALGENHPATIEDEQRSAAALAELLKLGKADDDIHPDVTVDDVYLLFSTAPSDQPRAARCRWITLVLPGLTTHPRPHIEAP